MMLLRRCRGGRALREFAWIGWRIPLRSGWKFWSIEAGKLLLGLHNVGECAI